MSEEENPPIKKRGRGRPKKSEVATARKTGKVGRPKGTAAIMNEYRDRMLTSPKSKAVLESIFDAALDPEHKNQAAAWKLIMDRVAPAAMFEKEVTSGASRAAISINISGVGTASVEPKDIEGETFENGEGY